MGTDFRHPVMVCQTGIFFLNSRGLLGEKVGLHLADPKLPPPLHTFSASTTGAQTATILSILSPGAKTS